jgi:hypothetical protein
MTERLGDAPIEAGLRAAMNRMADAINEALNEGAARGKGRYGFIMMVFPFEGHEGRCNYISNANRDDVVTLLKEQLARFEGQPEVKGHA